MKLVPAFLCALALAGCDLENRHNKEAQVFKSSPEHYVIFSPLEGRLMSGGEPLANAKIIRTLKWNSNDEGVTATFYSDENGYFSLPAHEEELRISPLTQFAATAKLEVEVDGTGHDIWYNTKFTKEAHAETDGPVSDMVCDIAEEGIRMTAGHSTIMTVCRWPGMPEEDEY